MIALHQNDGDIVNTIIDLEDVFYQRCINLKDLGDYNITLDEVDDYNYKIGKLTYEGSSVKSIMTQTKSSIILALKALHENNGDISNTINSLKQVVQKNQCYWFFVNLKFHMDSAQ